LSTSLWRVVVVVVVQGLLRRSVLGLGAAALADSVPAQDFLLPLERTTRLPWVRAVRQDQ
jgi:hypothetical protein